MCGNLTEPQVFSELIKKTGLHAGVVGFYLICSNLPRTLGDSTPGCGNPCLNPVFETNEMHVVLVHTEPTDTNAIVPAAHTVRNVVYPTE